jgi:ubiquinone/menaquinone biosynthesis C-methylase UbiE
MNENHANLCSSAEWAQGLQDEIVEPLARPLELGEEMLEIGPGPGAATEWLSQAVSRLVSLETDAEAAEALGRRFAGGNVEVVVGDAAQMEFPDRSFDSVACFTMLHHVPTDSQQNLILSEALRVLRPGGVLFGADSPASQGLHEFHADDIYNPIEPGSFLTRLRTIGFVRLTVSVDDVVRFIAYRPKEER